MLGQEFEGLSSRTASNLDLGPRRILHDLFESNMISTFTCVESVTSTSLRLQLVPKCRLQEGTTLLESRGMSTESRQLVVSQWILPCFLSLLCISTGISVTHLSTRRGITRLEPSDA